MTSLKLDMPDNAHLLKGGANNQVYKVELNNQPLILKKYFFHKNDERDRLHHEFSFLEYAWSQGVRCIPEPIAKEKKMRYGIYSFINGQPAKISDITSSAVEQAISFFLQLNQRKEEANLPFASEACFSNLEYISVMEKKFACFFPFTATDALEEEAKVFILQKLIPKWEKIKDIFKESFILNPEDRCVSPSDFGFHNALVDDRGMFYFIDFEYAGWDDPAKMICDFFLQPKIPVPMVYFEEFSGKVAGSTNDCSLCLKRTKKLFPLCQIRWCLIMLGIFSHAGKQRRKFSLSLEKKEEQLKKAKTLFETIE